MTGRGRPRKSARATALGGNAGKRKPRVNVQPTEAAPVCPAHLDKRAQIEWQTLAPELTRLGLLTIVDRTAFAAYCQSWSNWVFACEQLKKEGHVAMSDKGNAYLSPWVTVATQSLNDLNRFGAPFGLTPGARRRLDVKPAEPEDELAIFLKRKGK